MDGCSEQPVFTFRPQAIDAALNCFRHHFQADTLYAVKANPSQHVLQHLIQNGVTTFDVASIEEIKLIQALLPDAELFYMHPIKSRLAIRRAYFEFGVRHFSLDSEAELEKIITETNHAHDLNLHVRLAIPNLFSEMSLAKKFGVDAANAPGLLKNAGQYAQKLGICFHVGSQCMHPEAYGVAIGIAAKTIEAAAEPIHFFNVGGGFPSIYPGMQPPPLSEYFEFIQRKFREIPEHQNMRLLCEPGRAFVAESGALVVNVIARRNNTLYINCGTYGALFDAGTPKFIFPTRLLRKTQAPLQGFDLYGPTCDSLDYMPGPFYLPADIQEGDYFEIGQLGAYSSALATQFNGFIHKDEVLTIEDKPLMSLYEAYQHQPQIQLIA